MRVRTTIFLSLVAPLLVSGLACDESGDGSLDSSPEGSEATEASDNDDEASGSESEAEGEEGSGDDSADSSSGDAGDEVGESETETDAAEYSLSMSVELRASASGEELDFLTPSGNVISMPAEELVGRPFYFGVYPGGFGQGVDLALYEEWGSVSDSLRLDVATPAEFPTGPYDLALIIYTKTEITDEHKSAEQPPVPVAGELSSFTLSQSEILDGDPGFSNGVVRVNIIDGDASLQLENRTDLELGVDVFTNTVLTVP